MKTLKSYLSRLMCIALTFSVPALTFAAEESISRKSERLAGEFNSIVVLLLTAAQAVALFMMWSGLSKIKKDKEQPGQGLMGQGFMYCVSAILLYFLPRLIGMGEATFFP